MADIMLQTKPDTVKASYAYEAGAWNNPNRDFTNADWTPLNWSEDKLFNDITRRTVLRRIRHEVRNNPYLAGLVAKFPEAIGVGEYKVRVGDKAYKETVETQFYRDSKNIEVSGETLFQVQRIISSELLVAGEIFIVLLSNGKIQLVPSENCAQPPEAKPNTINGIDRDSDGKPTGYHFAKLDQWGNLDWNDVGGAVDARNVIHVFDRDRVAMGRGLPWVLPSICTARDLYEITGSKTKQIKDASSISGTITKNNADDFAAQLASAQNAALNAQIVAAGGTAQAQPVSNTNTRQIKLEKGTMFFLEPGEKADFVQNSYQAQDYNQLIMLMLHAISSPVGLPVELWFSGLGDVNYSGFKGLGVQWDSRRMHIIDLLESRWLNRFAVWWVQWNRKRGNLPPAPDNYDDDDFEWVWKQTAVLDADKAAAARMKRLESGDTSLPQEWEAQGFMPAEVLESRKLFWDQCREVAGLPPAPCPMEFLLANKMPEVTATVSTTNETPNTNAGDQGDAAATGQIQSAALNGAQVASLVEIAAKVASGELPANSGIAIAEVSFPLVPKDLIAKIFNLTGFTPKPAQ